MQSVCSLRWRKKNHHRKQTMLPAWTHTPALLHLQWTMLVEAVQPRASSRASVHYLGSKTNRHFSPPDIHTFSYVTGAEVCALKAACQIQGLGGSTNASNTLDEIEGGEKNTNPNTQELVQIHNYNLGMVQVSAAVLPWRICTGLGQCWHPDHHLMRMVRSWQSRIEGRAAGGHLSYVIFKKKNPKKISGSAARKRVPGRLEVAEILFWMVPCADRTCRFI